MFVQYAEAETNTESHTHTDEEKDRGREGVCVSMSDYKREKGEDRREKLMEIGGTEYSLKGYLCHYNHV